jgi:ABC-type multidrug transport system fused ATPase/permease subunit
MSATNADKQNERARTGARPAVPAEEEVDQRPLDGAIIRRLAACTRPYARKRNVLLALVALRALQLPALGWVVGAMLSGPVARHDQRGTLLGALGFLLLAVFTEVSFHFRLRLSLELGEAVVHDLRNAIYKHLLRMPLAYFQARTGRVGRIISRTISDVDNIRVGVQDVVFTAVVHLGTMLVAAALMIYYDWLLFLVVLGMVPLLWRLLGHFRQRLSRAHRAVHESFSRVTSSLAESVTGVRVTQGFVREDINGGLFRQLIDAHSRNNMEVVRHSSVFLPMLEFNGQLFIAILLAVGGVQTLAGDIRIGVLVQFLFLSNLFFNPIPVLGTLYNQALTAMAGAERVWRLLDTPPDWTDAPDAQPPPRPLAGKVELRDVSFSYGAAPDSPAVLRAVSFVAEPGQTVALVGPTGSGKSTILGLIAKFHLPSSGQLFIDGREIRTLRGDGLRQQMGNVLQNNFLFSGTVMDNVRIGRPSASDQEIVAAAESLGVRDLIEDLPGGFATRVGEKGGGLSLGQRQIVCFCRAMLADPRILLLDEATSAVDTMTELRLQRALAKLLRGRTSFVVAHRLSTIRHADKVLVVEAGRIVEEGTHRQLLARGGTYAALHKAFVRANDAAPKARNLTAPPTL